MTRFKAWINASEDRRAAFAPILLVAVIGFGAATAIGIHDGWWSFVRVLVCAFVILPAVAMAILGLMVAVYLLCDWWLKR